MLEINLDNLDDVEEEIKGLYTEKDGKYVLGVNLDGFETLDGVAGLKQQQAKMLDEVKAAKARTKELEDSIKAAEHKAAEEKQDFQKLYENTLADLEGEREQNSGFREQVESAQKKIASDALGSSLTNDAQRSRVLSDYAMQYATFEDGAIAYKMGGVIVSEDAVKAHLSKEYPFLVDGNSANGGGATGSVDSSGAAKVMKRADFDVLNPMQQMEFVRKGGKTED
jgi:hypothetical protein